MQVVIEVPARLKEQVETWLKGHDVRFEISGRQRARFEMPLNDEADLALLGLWDSWRDANVNTLTIKAD